MKVTIQGANAFTVERHMKPKPHVTLTVEPDTCRVDFVDELSTLLTAENRRRLLLPSTRQARQRVGPILALIGPQLEGLRGVLPLYVLDAIDGLMAAVRRWESEEKEAQTNNA